MNYKSLALSLLYCLHAPHINIRTLQDEPQQTFGSVVTPPFLSLAASCMRWFHRLSGRRAGICGWIKDHLLDLLRCLVFDVEAAVPSVLVRQKRNRSFPSVWAMAIWHEN